MDTIDGIVGTDGTDGIDGTVGIIRTVGQDGTIGDMVEDGIHEDTQMFGMIHVGHTDLADITQDTTE